MHCTLLADVTATDLTGLSATFTLTVVIDDVDEPPVFNPTSCQASIPEDLVRQRHMHITNLIYFVFKFKSYVLATL